MLTRSTLRDLLGLPEDSPEPPTLRFVGATNGQGPHSVRLHGAGSAPIPAVYFCPTGPGPHPAVLYCHAHGNRYDRGADELSEGRPALLGPYGPALAALGFASLAIDLPGFGTRQAEGPESALAKAALWRGTTLFGRMLEELTQARRALADQPNIDGSRIAALGLSMGGTLAYWLAALDDGVAAVAHLCVFSDIAPLLKSGDHDLHGPYLTVPGLLAHGDMGDVAGLIAPRPQLVAIGGQDPLTPEGGDGSGMRRLRRAYASVPDALTEVISPRTGHVETPEMRAKVLDFLAHRIGPRPLGNNAGTSRS